MADPGEGPPPPYFYTICLFETAPPRPYLRVWMSGAPLIWMSGSATVIGLHVEQKAHVRSIKILTRVIFLYLVWFSLCSSLLSEMRDNGIVNDFVPKPRSHVRILTYRTWAIGNKKNPRTAKPQFSIIWLQPEESFSSNNFQWLRVDFHCRVIFMCVRE